MVKIFTEKGKTGIGNRLWGEWYVVACIKFEMALMGPTIYVKHTIGYMRLELGVQVRLKIKTGSLIIWMGFKAMAT